MPIAKSALGAALVAVCSTVAAGQTQEKPGIFVAPNGGGESVRLEGVMAQQMHPKGVAKSILKATLTQGLLGGGGSVEFVLDGAAATVRVKDASFLIRLNPQGQRGAPPDPSAMDLSSIMAGGFDMMPPQAKSGEEFVLARMTVADGSRHLEASQSRHGTLKTKAAVPLQFERSGPNVVTARPRTPLEPGEYAFYYGGVGGGGQFWTFGVDPR